MARTGRPKIEAEKRKASFLTLRLSDDERALIDNAAKQSETKATTWAREILLAEAKKNS